MSPTAEPVQAFARLQLVNALIWALTVMGAAVVVKASDNFIYLLLVLVAGSVCSWAAIWEMSAPGSTPAPGP